MSVFETFTYGKSSYSFFVWAGNFLYFSVFLGVVYWYANGRMESLVSAVFEVPISMVRLSKLGMFGGSYLMMSSLFVGVLFVNVVGTIPYVLSMSSHFVYSLSFAFPFWFGLVSSSLALGGLRKCMAGLVFSGLPVAGGWVLCWVEIFSIFLRWITLMIRLSANMTIGQILLSMLSQWTMFCYYSGSSFLLVVMSMVSVSGLLLAEVAVSMIQAYVFCSLLSIYSNEHSV